MKKRSLAFGIVCILLGLLLCSCFENVTGKDSKSGTVKTEDGETNWTLSDEGVLSVSGTGTLCEVPVEKESVKTVKVEKGFTAIGVNAFADLTEVKEIEIPEGITKIEDRAFGNCCGIEKIQLPDSVESIADTAFEGWQKTQKIIADWYEGSADYWKEWYDYNENFKDYIDDIKNGVAIPDDVQCKISTWWQEWKSSEYWNDVEKIAEAGAEHADSSFDYWLDFGKYIIGDENIEVTDENSWWVNAKNLIGYFEERINNSSVEVPEEIKEILESNKGNIDSAIEYFKSKIGTMNVQEDAENFKEKFSNIWGAIYGSKSSN